MHQRSAATRLMKHCMRAGRKHKVDGPRCGAIDFPQSFVPMVEVAASGHAVDDDTAIDRPRRWGCALLDGQLVFHVQMLPVLRKLEAVRGVGKPNERAVRVTIAAVFLPAQPFVY